MHRLQQLPSREQNRDARWPFRGQFKFPIESVQELLGQVHFGLQLQSENQTSI